MDSSRSDQEPVIPHPHLIRAPAKALAQFDLIAWLEQHEQNRPPRLSPTAMAVPIGRTATPLKNLGDAVSRASAYLAKVPPAVAGKGGHNQTFHAACILVQGFGLSIDQARTLLQNWNQSCVPPWSPAELEHKLLDASKADDDRPRGYLCDQTEPARKKTLRHDSSHGRPGSTDKARADHETPQTHHGEPVPFGQEANPHRLAELFLASEVAFKGGIGLRYWRDEFHLWDGTAYKAIPASEMRAWTTRWLADEFRRLYQLSLAEIGEGSLEHIPAERPARRHERSRGAIARPIPVTGRIVSDVMQALASLVVVSTREVPSQPAWIPAWPISLDSAIARPEPPLASLWPADEILPSRNALVHLPSLVTGAPHTLPPSPCFFNGHALGYEYDPLARAPREWLRFLEQIWGTDAESIAALQEWFGYLLTPDTRQQKILMMVGPKRSGRGTIARVLKELAGVNSVVNPTLSTLARPFGLATLIGKPIAIFPDARLSSRPDNAAIVECLLSVSGEDDQTIDRKHMPAWTGKLSTRFVLISNELPRLRDASGALAGRLVILRFTHSFYGREDMALFDRLRPELPGILRWAIGGWERLRMRGRFTQPGSGRELLATMDELASPITAFLRDRCVVEPDARCPVAAIYESWRSWCQERGREAVGDEHSFGRDLHAAVPGLATIRPRSANGRPRHYQGVRLRSDSDTRNDSDEHRDPKVIQRPHDEAF
jgi:putative DNA primase/helicase